MHSQGSISAKPSNQRPGKTDSNDDASAVATDIDEPDAPTAPTSKGRTLGHTQRPPLPTEILQEILQCLDFRTLAQCQRVSRIWNAAIARSPRLQQALFFSGSLADARRGAALVFKIVVDTEVVRTDQIHHQPIFWIDLSKHFTHSYYPHRDEGRLDPGGITFNPILEDIFGSTHLLNPDSNGYTLSDPLRIQFNGLEDPEHFVGTTPSPRPSWRRMLISQPPVQTVTMECDFTFDPSYRCKSWTPYNVEGGIRMEGLLLLVQSLVESSFDDYLRDERCRLGESCTYHRDTEVPLSQDEDIIPSPPV
jgi:hypothetical protein